MSQRNDHEPSPISSWLPAPESLTLSGDEVHVWLAFTNQTASRVQSLERTLAEDERKRVDRFHFQKDRRHYIVARGLLRAILGRYLNVPPSQLRFSYSPYGKPALTEEFGGDALSFNLSHSGEIVLYAVTHGRQIGIDLELMRPDFGGMEIAERFFSHREVTTLRALPPDAQQEAFFNCWTRKEAYIKASGEGLSRDLKQFAVSLAPGEQTELLSTAWDAGEAARWSLTELLTAYGYVAALAVEGHDWQLKCWRWAEP